MPSEYGILLALIVVMGAALKMRHIFRSISTHFQGCRNIPDVVRRAWQLDDITLGGIFFWLAIMITVPIGIVGELTKSKG